MSLDADIDTLSRIPVLAALEHEHLRLLVFASETLRLADGQELFRAGANAECAYVVRTGSLILAVPGSDREQEVTAGSVLGELSLLATTTRPTNARAKGDTELLRIGRTALRRVLQEYPDRAAIMHEMLRQRLAAMTRDVGELGKRFE